MSRNLGALRKKSGAKNNFGAKENNFTKLFYVTCREAGMIIWVQVFGGCTCDIWDGQNIQNSARFRTTSDFYRKYIRNRLTNHKVSLSHLEPPKIPAARGVSANLIAFRPRDVSPVGFTAPGGLRLGCEPNFYLLYVSSSCILWLRMRGVI